jgi:hypothetical protein
MKRMYRGRVLYLLIGLAFAAAFSGCAEVHQNPASNVVNAASDAPATQQSGAQAVRPSSVPF